MAELTRLLAFTTPWNSFVDGGGHPTWRIALASLGLIWYLAVILVSMLGCVQLCRCYSARPTPSISSSLPLEKVPRVTVLRPVKGLDAYLSVCLSSIFRQDYPRERLTICFCLSSRGDPAYPVLRSVLACFPGHDARILVEDEDAGFEKTSVGPKRLGPNPKIRNMSRAYREAKGDIVWVLDCNVWVGRGVAGRMVDRLCGFGPRQGNRRKFKFVHQLPLVVYADGNEFEPILPAAESGRKRHSSSTHGNGRSDNGLIAAFRGRWGYGDRSALGARLEEVFMSSAHAKFYTAINTVLIAPCVVGKSNMFRRSHLDHLTTSSDSSRPSGLDYFSHNICEDHLLGDLLWKGETPADASSGGDDQWGKHALVYGDLAFQPMQKMSLGDYVGRRIRWLRVRKFTVVLATLVEPGTESFLCSLYGAYAITTFAPVIGLVWVPPWFVFVGFWVTSIFLWSMVDRFIYLRLHSGRSVELDQHTPWFAASSSPPSSSLSLDRWIYAWFGREALAFPIWVCAIFGGVTVHWRGQRFWVSIDMTVHELADDDDHHPLLSTAHRWLWGWKWKPKRR